jgi:hypothetical protein
VSSVLYIAISALVISGGGIFAQWRKRDSLSARLAKALDSDDFPVAADEAAFHDYVGLISWGFILVASVAAVVLQLARP